MPAKTTNKRRRRARPKILSPYSRRVLQDLADQDCQLIESRTQRTIYELNDLHKLEEKLEAKLDETLQSVQYEPMRF